MNQLYKLLCFSFLALSFQSSLAQSTTIPLNRQDYQWLDRFEIQTGNFAPDFNSFNKGISRDDLMHFVLSRDSENISMTRVDERNLQWLCNDNFEYAGDLPNSENNYPIFNLIYNKKTDFYSLSNDDLTIKINPVLFYQGGASSSNAYYKFYNTRGVEFRGNLRNKVGFYSYIGENQWSAPEYVKEEILNNYAVPGQGFFKPLNKLNKKIKYTGVDFLDARGYVTFSALKNMIHFSFGQDKNFMGYGMRSLFLSDNANSNLFFKINTHYGRFDYQNLFTQLVMQHPKPNGDYLYPKKFATFHHLNFNVTNNLKIGIFEGVLFSRNKQYELQYLTPVIFYRQVEQALGSPDNAVMGADGSAILFKHFQAYGQFFLDEFTFELIKINPRVWTNKFGIQAGLKYINVLGISNLDAQVELNVVRPYTYSHRDSLSNYTHYNQSLAHPTGANFKEICGKISYQPRHRLTVNYSFAAQIVGLDTLGSDWGSNPLISYNKRPSRLLQGDKDYTFQYHIGDGVRTTIFVSDLVVSYQFAHNMYVDFNYIHRSQLAAVSTLNRLEDYYAVGVRINFARNTFLF